MKIGFDGRYAQGDLVGVGKYIRSLLSELSTRGVECVIFYSRPPKYKIDGKNIKSVVLRTKNRYFFEQVLLPIALIKEKVDLYHAPGNMGIPLFCPVPSVLTIHDIIPLEIDNYFSYSPLPCLSKLSYLFRLKTSLLKATKIVTVSGYVKKQLIKVLGIKDEKITTIYSGLPKVSTSGVLPKNLVGGKYILNNGGIDIRKNLDNLLKAFAVVNIKHPEMKLVITGENARIRKQLDGLVDALSLNQSVIFTGYLNEADLVPVIKNAELVCYPSLSEGFGFPLLEAFGLGVPVVASNVAAIPEIAGWAALLVRPDDAGEISRAILEVLDSPKLREKMIDEGKRQSTKFSWEKGANEYLSLYNSFK
jgi:glycosyltransferase involved in cell wall biosynthesis